MQSIRSFLAHAVAAVGLVVLMPAHAQNTIKVGVIAEFSGPFADYGGQI
jgi:branched-chain amino acid transport system substrate-binding protein